MAYVTLAELKAELGIPDADTRKDTELTALLGPASDSVDAYCNRTFVQSAADVEREYDTTGASLVIDDLVTMTAIESQSGTSWVAMSTDDVVLLPRNAPVDGRPYTQVRTVSGAVLPTVVRITGTWGWDAVPDVVTRAALVQAVLLFNTTAVPLGFAGGDPSVGVLRVSGDIHPHAKALLSNLQRPGIG